MSAQEGDAAALLVLSVALTPPFLTPDRLLRLIGMALATAAHNGPAAHWDREAWRNALVHKDTGTRSG